MKEYPANLKYTADHEWVSLNGNEVTVGITAFAAGELGDLVYLDLRAAGTYLEAGEVFGTIEAVKTVSDLIMPVSGTITAVNILAISAPEEIAGDVYGMAGWLIKVLLEDPAETEGLLERGAYYKLIA
ncbi:glycine cleavage system protein H [Mucilaginibacter corticis]|uniref:Glycine cleavage system H protein n=1 Tax=Mucilaginibacter corticis TaxID=2597670 RepID=A0A556M7S2_9SPHI|nr:glycine cleavage system H protein [Mucilaginibacter corticis]TSJ35937.1 glycine cleavage system protein H [Mucilaginibacter corticis]